MAVNQITPDKEMSLAIHQPCNKTVSSKSSLVPSNDQEQEIVIQDLANVIQSNVIQSDSPSKGSNSMHTQVHIPKRRAILHPPSMAPTEHQEDSSMDLIKDGPASQDMDMEAIQQCQEPARDSNSIPIIPTHLKVTTGVQSASEQCRQEGSAQQQPKKKQKDATATGREQLLANAHAVQFPPSGTIDLTNTSGENAETQPSLLAIKDPSAEVGSNTQDSSRRRVRGSKAEQEKPLDAAELRKRQKSLNKKEEALKVREKRMEQVERDLAKARAHIIILEARIKDQEESNRILNQRILASEASTQAPTAPLNQGTSYPSQPAQAPPTPVFSSSREDTPNNAQILHRIELMQMEMKLSQQEMKHNQELNNMKQSYMLDKVMTMQSSQAPPVLFQPPLQYSYPGIHSARQPTWWGPAPPTWTTPAYTSQQMSGSYMSGSSRPVNRYIPNPLPNPVNTQPQSHSADTMRTNAPGDQHQGSAQPQPEATAQEVPRDTKHRSMATPQSEGSSTDQASRTEDMRGKGAQPKENSFLYPTGPTNHMTNKNQ